MVKHIWGIDLGGTKIEGIVAESFSPAEPIIRKRIDTEGGKGYHHIVNQIYNLIETMSDETGIHPEKIGIGTPGTIDPSSGLLKNCNTTILNGTRLREDLEKKTGVPFLMSNDANCFALAETKLGGVPKIISNPEVVVGLIMGTGVGSGIVVNGKIINGRHGIAGEWGHNVLEENGFDCYCGKKGCVEQIISGPSLQNFYKSIGGKDITLKEIMQNYFEGHDPYASKTVERLIYYFGKGVAALINILDPDVIVLGGGLGNIDLLYSEGVEEVKKYIFNPRLETIFLKPQLGDSAGVFGAAMLCL